MRALVLVLGCCGTLGSAADAMTQSILWERTGQACVERFAGPIAVLSDLDGDGYPELAHVGDRVGSSFEVWILSGRDGTRLRTVPDPPLHVFDALTEAGDMDGDGVRDYAVQLRAVGPPVSLTNLVEVRSGRDDHVIWSVSGNWLDGFGTALLGDLDLDGDGAPDLVVTSHSVTPAGGGEVRTFDNRGQPLYLASSTAELLLALDATDQTLGRLGGDMDGDGCDDFVVGGLDLTPPGSGVAVVLSGKTGAVLRMARDPRPGDNIGEAVDGCGDVDGDGVLDFASGNFALFTRGMAAMFSGATGAPIHVWRASEVGIGFDGQVLSGGIDVDRDGVPDLIVGAPQMATGLPVGGTGVVLAFSGRDGSILFRDGARGFLGFSVAVLGPFPGSAFPVFAAGAPQFGRSCPSPVNWEGLLVVYRGAPPGVATLGTPCPGTLATSPTIGARALRLVTADVGARITLFGGAAGQPALLLLGTSRTSFAALPLPLPLDRFGFPGCRLLTSIDVVIPRIAGAAGIDAGYTAVDLPATLSPTGVPVYAQWLSLAPERIGGGGASDALELEVVPR